MPPMEASGRAAAYLQGDQGVVLLPLQDAHAVVQDVHRVDVSGTQEKHTHTGSHGGEHTRNTGEPHSLTQNNSVLVVFILRVFMLVL